MTPVEIVAQLRILRQELGLTLRQVAERSGVPMSTIAHCELATVEGTPEHRRSVPRVDTLERWALALGREVGLTLTPVDTFHTPDLTSAPGSGQPVVADPAATPPPS